MKEIENYNDKQKNENSHNLAVDFDGVIHDHNLGFHDGTIYGKPIKGSLEAIKKLAKTHRIIVYTCKAKPDRPEIKGKTGTQMVWDWLKKHGIASCVAEVTSEKPRAKYYIDDRAIQFKDWNSCLLLIQ